ncbi:MAG: hypothetical protein II359_02495 [Clostridia bacterium]|nr:hypothetical protein [Clostridia bacterium]
MKDWIQKNEKESPVYWNYNHHDFCDYRLYLWGIRQNEEKPHTYVKKTEIEAVFEENGESFMDACEYFKDKKSAMVLYNLLYNRGKGF